MQAALLQAELCPVVRRPFFQMANWSRVSPVSMGCDVPDWRAPGGKLYEATVTGTFVTVVVPEVEVVTRDTSRMLPLPPPPRAAMRDRPAALGAPYIRAGCSGDTVSAGTLP